MHTENSNYENGLEIHELPAAFFWFSGGIIYKPVIYVQTQSMMIILPLILNFPSISKYQNIFKRFDFC